jgi:hypothetical protein
MSNYSRYSTTSKLAIARVEKEKITMASYLATQDAHKLCKWLLHKCSNGCTESSIGINAGFVGGKWFGILTYSSSLDSIYSVLCFTTNSHNF